VFTVVVKQISAQERKQVMKRNFLMAVICVSALVAIASAGTLSGNVKGSGSSVVYLESVQAKAAAPAPAQVYKMDQKGMKFIPSVLVVPVGATVEFDNDDAGSHNVRWPSIGGQSHFGHNLGTFGAGQKGTWKFEHAGVVPLMCTMHPDMSAYIIVTPSPYFAQTDQILGDYFIQNVPDGQYKATVWHNGKTTTKLVTVAGTTKLDFALGK
jgi:plastocyanin